MVGTGLTAVVGFAFWAIAAHEYSSRVVGLNSAAVSAMTFISGACTLGLEAVLLRYVPTAGRLARRLILSSYLVTVALSLAVGAVAAATSALWSPALRFLGNDAGWLVGFALATAGWTVFTLQDTVMIALRSAQWVPLENALYSVVKLIVLAALAGALPQAGIFIAWTGPLVFAILAISLLIFRRLLPPRAHLQPAALLGRRKLFAVSAGNYGGMLFASAATTLVPVAVANIAGAAETAYFYVPWTIAMGLQLVTLNMSISLTVEAALDEARLRVLTRQTLKHMVRLLLPPVLVCTIAAPWLLRIFGPNYAHDGATLLRLLALGTVPNLIVGLGIGVARIQHSGRAVLLIQAAQCVIVLGLSVVMLPSAGINGVGIAWLVSQLAVAGVLVTGMLRPILLPIHGGQGG
jgi:O-antigen/teichoic acid export membrane protein